MFWDPSVVVCCRWGHSGGLDDKTRNWFDGYASDVGYEVRELRVEADDRLEFCWFVYHVTGALQSGDEVEIWVRATLCCERVDGSGGSTTTSQCRSTRPPARPRSR